MKEILEIVNSKKRYIYQSILSYIYQNPNKYKNETPKEIIIDLDTFVKDIMIILEEYTAKNKIKVDITKNCTNFKEKIKQYFINIIKFLNAKKENLRREHIEILQNLLSLKNFKKRSNNLHDLINKRTFGLEDFVIYYSEIASKILFNNGNFSQEDSEKLNDIYLYYIFQIKDLEISNKLKILIYTELYGNCDINNIKNFINKSSKEIVNKETDNNFVLYELHEFQNKYGEYNFNIFSVSNENINYFGKDLKKNNDDFFKMFNPNIIGVNTSLIEDKNNTLIEEQITIDDLNYDNDKNKIHLFTPQFLIVNGLKSKFEDSDFQIFNNDNYYVELFGKFLRKIIEELNNSINKKNFINDFMKNHLIKFHQNINTYYISAKLDKNDKEELNSNAKENKGVNQFIKLEIYQSKYYKKEKVDYNKNCEIKSDKTNSRSDILSKSMRDSISDEVKKMSDDFENLLNEKLQKNIEKNKLIALPNIIFLFNLKIPVFNKEKNSIEFKSVYLNYLDNKNNQNNQNNKKYNKYGFKEIDSVFQNNSTINIDADYENCFYINLNFIKEINNNYFYHKKIDKLSIYSESIFFCEIKNKFPNISSGNEESHELNIEKKEEGLQINNDDEPKSELDPYKNELKKLIKKFIFFYNIYKENCNIKNIKNIQIVFLYDFINVDTIVPKPIDLKNETEKILWYFAKRLKNIGNIIFQLIFFDNNLHTQLQGIKIEEQKKVIEQYKKENENKNNEIRQQKIEIEQKNNEIKKQKNEIDQYKKENENKNNEIRQQKIEIEQKNNEIKKQKMILEKMKAIINQNMSEEQKKNIYIDLNNDEQNCF